MSFPEEEERILDEEQVEEKAALIAKEDEWDRRDTLEVAREDSAFLNEFLDLDSNPTVLFGMSSTATRNLVCARESSPTWLILATTCSLSPHC